MARDKTFIFPENYRFGDFKNSLEEKYSLRTSSQTSFYETYFDTFDWRIYNAGYVLIQKQNTLLLSRLSSVGPELSATIERPFNFFADLSDSKLKRTLDPITGARALIAKVKVHAKETRIDCLNSDQKIVCRLTFKAVNHAGKSIIHTVRIGILRGYSSAATSIVKILNPEKSEANSSDIFLYILKALKINPGDYSSKIVFELDPGMPAAETLRLILKKLLSVIRINESGVIDDIDTEFLHDFRVAVRRTRAVLSQLPDAFPTDMVGKFKKDFSWLGKLSNKLRDFDVYLLNEKQYLQIVPAPMQKEIATLFNKLRTERKKEQQKVANALRSKKYQNVLDRWDKFLNSDSFGESGKKSILDFVKQIILDQFLRIIEQGRTIDEGGPDRQLHKLRIECKKLRYLLEFFSSLFETGQIEILVKQLKSLQDNLGAFNDYSVQQTFLNNQIKHNVDQASDTQSTAAALGALIGILYQEQRQVRLEFNDRFSKFAGKNNIEIANRLFG